MPRRRQHEEEARAAPSQAPVIHPTQVFTAQQLRQALGLRANTIRGEVREGRLRFSKLAGRYWFLGAWVLEWIEGGEAKYARRPRRKREEAEVA